MKIKRRLIQVSCFCILVGILLLLLGASDQESQQTSSIKGDNEKTLVSTKLTPVDVIANFVFAGWMGDGEKFGDKAIALNDSCTENPHSSPSCIKITYRNLPGSIGWTGVYAQYNVRQNGNWGDRLGINLNGYNKLVFYARGDKGGESVEFKVGGIDAPGKPYKDSFEYSIGTIKLEKEWKRYEMDLSKEDLSSVIGGFCWVATTRSNPNDLTFYLDSITYEKEDKGQKQFQEKLLSYRWVAYSPTNCNPDKGIKPPNESVKEDLLLLNKYFDGIVTYGASDIIPQIAKEADLKGMLFGIWDPRNKEELAMAKASATNEFVLGYVVGNEGLDERYDYDTVKQVIKDLSSVTGKPVTTTEQLNDYSNPRMLELGDWIFPNVHPYFYKFTKPVEAAEWTERQYKKLSSKTEKLLLLKEVGLPSAGDEGLSEENQAEYYRLLQKTSTHFVYFEAFDKPWRTDPPVEPHWGLFRSDRTPKLIVEQLTRK